MFCNFFLPIYLINNTWGKYANYFQWNIYITHWRNVTQFKNFSSHFLLKKIVCPVHKFGIILVAAILFSSDKKAFDLGRVQYNTGMGKISKWWLGNEEENNKKLGCAYCFI